MGRPAGDMLWRIEWGWGDDWVLLDLMFTDADARWRVALAAATINGSGRSPNGDRGCAAVPIPRKDGWPRAYRLRGLDSPAWLRARAVYDTAESD